MPNLSRLSFMDSSKMKTFIFLFHELSAFSIYLQGRKMRGYVVKLIGSLYEILAAERSGQSRFGCAICAVAC